MDSGCFQFVKNAKNSEFGQNDFQKFVIHGAGQMDCELCGWECHNASTVADETGA